MNAKPIFLALILTICQMGSADIIHIDDLGDSQIGAGSFTAPYRDLQTAVDSARDYDTLFVHVGNYIARNHQFIDTLCGNCENHKTEVKASYGFLIQGKSLVIAGAKPDSVILLTNSGYGVFIDNCEFIQMQNIVVTGGVRDFDGNATDAAIVVRNSRAEIDNCVIRDNTNRPDSIVVGIGGIMGREGAEMTITNNRIENNSWDGIALYRGATATIADNIINGGRGAGIGITWDANAVIYRNKVSNFWKGIGAFGDSRVICTNNAIFDNLGWGIIVTGTAYMDASNNVIHHNGNCGMAIWSEECTGRFSNNIIAENGWRDQWVCPCVGIWNCGSLFNFDISYNDVWNNKAGQYGEMPDMTDRNGNISRDPLFIDSSAYILNANSLLINAGNPLITDLDGSRSDIGLGGGPRARK